MPLGPVEQALGSFQAPPTADPIQMCVHLTTQRPTSTVCIQFMVPQHMLCAFQVLSFHQEVPAHGGSWDAA